MADLLVVTRNPAMTIALVVGHAVLDLRPAALEEWIGLHPAARFDAAVIDTDETDAPLQVARLRKRFPALPLVVIEYGPVELTESLRPNVIRVGMPLNRLALADALAVALGGEPVARTEDEVGRALTGRRAARVERIGRPERLAAADLAAGTTAVATSAVPGAAAVRADVEGLPTPAVRDVVVAATAPAPTADPELPAVQLVSVPPAPRAPIPVQVTAASAPGPDVHRPGSPARPKGLVERRRAPNQLATARSLLNQLERFDELVGLPQVADVVVSGTVDVVAADGCALLVPDGCQWRVSAGIGLRRLEQRIVLEADHWLIREVVNRKQGLLVEETTLAREALRGAPLASRRHVAAVGVPLVDAVLVVGRFEDPPFDDRALKALVQVAIRAAGLLDDALAVRDLARKLFPFVDPIDALGF